LVEGVARLGNLPSNLSFPWVTKRIMSALLGYLFAGNFCFDPGSFGAIDLGLATSSVYGGFVVTMDTPLFILRLLS